MTAEWMTGTEESLEGTTELGSVRDETLGGLRFPGPGTERLRVIRDTSRFRSCPPAT